MNNNKILLLLIIHCSLLIVHCSLVSAQTWQELNNKIKEYEKQGDEVNVVKYAEKAFQQAEKEFKKNDTNYITALNIYAVKQIKDAEVQHGNNSKYYAIILNYFAILYEAIETNKQENLALKQADKIEYDILYQLKWEFLTNKCEEFNSKEQYKKALKYAEIAKEKATKELSKNDSNYILVLNNLAFFFNKLDNYNNSEKLYLEAIEINKVIHGEKNRQYVESLNALAELYKTIGNYNKSEQLYLESINILKEIYGEKNKDYGISLNCLAQLYQEMGNYSKSEQLFIDASNIIKELSGEKNKYYAANLNNLALLYKETCNFKKAEQLFLKSDSILKEITKEKSPDYASNINNLALLYEDINNYIKAEQLLIKSSQLIKDLLGENNIKYAGSLHDLAGLYKIIGNYSKAEKLFIESNKIIKVVMNGENNSYYALSLDNLAQLYLEKYNFIKADSLFRLARDINKELYGEKNLHYIESLDNIAELYTELNDYRKAETYYLEANEISQELFGVNNINYIESLKNLAELYVETGNYKKAEQLYVEGEKISIEVYGEKNIHHAGSLYHLANLYFIMGKYSIAEKYYTEICNITRESLGENNLCYIAYLNSLADLYCKLGNYDKAEKLYLEFKKIILNIFGENNINYAGSLNNMAQYYNDIGNFDKSEQFYLESQQIIKNIFGENNVQYASNLLNIARLYISVNNFKKAEISLLKASNIYHEIYGTKGKFYASSLMDLALLYDKMHNYDKAESFYIESKQIYKEIFGENNYIYATLLLNLSNLYEEMNNYKKAELFCRKSINIYKKVFGENNPNLVASLNNLASLYYATGNYVKAEPLFIEANQILLEQLGLSFSFLSENEQQLFFTTIDYNFDVYHSFVLNRQKAQPRITGLSFNNELALKGALLQAGIQMRLSIINSGDIALVKIFDELQNLRQQINKLNTIEKNKRDSSYLVELDEKANELEKKLYMKSSVFKSYKELGSAKWEDIQKNLKTDEAAIEFISFDYHNGKKWTDSTFYCALVLRKDYKQPKMIKLCTEKELEEKIKGFLGYYKNIEEKLKECKNPYKCDTKAIEELKNSLYEDSNIYKLVWQPIDSLLVGSMDVYISLSGLLHKIPFDALKSNDGKYLLEKYNLHYLSSTREIANRNIKETEKSQDNSYNKTIALFGGLDYDEDSVKIVKNALAYRNKRREQTTTSYQSSDMWNTIPSSTITNMSFMGGNSRFDSLPATKEEVLKLDTLFRKNKWDTKLYIKDKGNEEAFKSLSWKKSPEIIYLSTHGYFSPDVKDTAKKKANELLQGEKLFTKAENPLLRSGLAMAGANWKWWKWKQLPDSIDDGILTAYEVSNTYLGNTDLVVMSACETGLGDIKNSEGVYGLQRAFKMAGAKSLIMSLWEVPEDQTRKFMSDFFKGYLETGDKYGSFHKAQKNLLEKEINEEKEYKEVQEKVKKYQERIKRELSKKELDDINDNINAPLFNEIGYFMAWAGFVLVE